MPRTARNRAPVIGRFGGLPGETVEAFSTSLCADAHGLFALEAELAACRAELADRLHDAVPGAEPELRRLLLNVRRDCHNGRGIARHERSAQWPLLADVAGALPARVREMEERAEAGWAAFRLAYDAEGERQRAALREPLRDPAFMRGLALASPDLYDACRHLAASPPGSARKDAKTEAALLRYVVRAAVKTSPFSTFTPVAVGEASADAGEAGLHVSSDGTEALSLVRLKRFRLGQLSDALCRYAPFRDRLPLALNDSAEETEPGRALLLRPGSWEGAPDRGTIRYRPDALVRVGLAAPFVVRVVALLAVGRWTFAEVAARLESEGAAEDAAAVRAQLERLVELGLLRPVLPWVGQAGHLEARMCDALRALPYDAALEPFTSRLERLVVLEQGYARASDPAASLREMRRLVDELWVEAAELGGPSFAGTAYRGTARYDLYEDVLLVPSAEEAEPAFRVSRNAVRRALRSAEPLAALAALCDDRQDFRAALASFAAETWPGRDEVGVLELFGAAQPLWREYLAFRSAAWQERDAGRTWNPREVPEVETLRACRATVLEGLAECVQAGADGDAWVDEGRLRSLLAAVPAAFTGGGAGACLFLQPASRDGSLWRLNAVREGTGRCGSRYTPAMPAALRREYAAHLRARGRVQVDGEPAELLDLFAVQGDTLNVHAPQTPAVLAFPGERTGVAPERRVPLGGLRVRFEGPARHVVLRGADGRRFVPVHLGLAYEAYMPPVVRFLMALGPSERGSVFPPAPDRTEGEVRVRARTTLGNLVIHRRTWSVPAAPLAAALAGADDARAFAAANRLRAAWGLPERAFVREATPHPIAGTVRKPRYVDFTSPLFLPVLRELAAAGEERLAVEEMLPGPDVLPRDGQGRRRAVELLVDSLALGRRTQRAEAAPLLRSRALAGRTPAGTAAG